MIVLKSRTEIDTMRAAGRVVFGVLDELKQHVSGDVGERIAAQERRFTTLADALELGLGRLREQANELRLLPASMAFPELERAVHDAAALTGKEVSFTARGGAVKLAGLHRRVRTLLSMTGVIGILDIHDAPGDALAAFALGEPPPRAAVELAHV